MNVPLPSAGDSIPAVCERIEVHVSELNSLFDLLDPTPFGQRDIDPKAAKFIVDWARDAPRAALFALLVHLDRAPGPANEASSLGQAVREFFRLRSTASQRQMRELFHNGRISLAIGLLFLTALITAGDFIAGVMKGSGPGEVLRESLLIGGWVAMWRPLEIFLYDWWPIRSDSRLYDRLSKMPVRITYTASGSKAPVMDEAT